MVSSAAAYGVIAHYIQWHAYNRRQTAGRPCSATYEKGQSMGRRSLQKGNCSTQHRVLLANRACPLNCSLDLTPDIARHGRTLATAVRGAGGFGPTRGDEIIAGSIMLHCQTGPNNPLVKCNWVQVMAHACALTRGSLYLTWQVLHEASAWTGSVAAPCRGGTPGPTRVV